MLEQSTISKSLAAQENLLLDYVQRLDKHRKGRRAVHIQLSKLRPHNRREQHVRSAANTFEGLVRSLQGQMFVLSNADIMFIFKKDVVDAVKSAIVKLRFMFADDPLMDIIDDGTGTGFEAWYDIETDFDRLMQTAQRLLSEAAARLQAQAQAQRFKGTKPPVKRRRPLTPEQLARIVRALDQADLSNLIRRQSVCALVGKSAPQPIFSELFVSIADLRETLIPNVDLTADRWLFQHMTDSLDRRVLALLSKHDDRTLDSDLSINLNVPTLLTDEFLKFDDNVKAGMRGSIVLELQKVDIYSDLRQFAFARDMAHEMGYRICIDGLSIHSLPYIHRERLGVDMLKVHWDPALIDIVEVRERRDRMEDILKRNGVGRIVLCRVDNEQAIHAGQALGITLFQGRYIEDGLISDEERRRVGRVLLIEPGRGEHWSTE